jgi:acyl-CoA reductase-like NAD-dependent aldehyde dehydrogenase
MRSGTININNGMFADPAIPFGGVKQSGYGQENGPEDWTSTSRPT